MLVDMGTKIGLSYSSLYPALAVFKTCGSFRLQNVPRDCALTSLRWSRASCNLRCLSMAISHTLRHLLNSAPTRGLRNCGSGVRRPDMWSGVCRPEVWGSGVRRPRCSGVCRPKRSGVLRPLPPTLLASTRGISGGVLQ